MTVLKELGSQISVWRGSGSRRSALRRYFGQPEKRANESTSGPGQKPAHKSLCRKVLTYFPTFAGSLVKVESTKGRAKSWGRIKILPQVGLSLRFFQSRKRPIPRQFLLSSVLSLVANGPTKVEPICCGDERRRPRHERLPGRSPRRSPVARSRLREKGGGAAPPARFVDSARFYPPLPPAAPMTLAAPNMRPIKGLEHGKSPASRWEPCGNVHNSLEL